MINTETLFFIGKLVLIGLIAYILGSVNTSIIVGKLRGINIKEEGSKNAGLTNTLRVMGKGAAGIVLIGDILKGVIAILIARLLAPSMVINYMAINETTSLPIIKEFTALSMQIAGIAVILGHIFPVFYGFKGGKGVLTSITVIMMVEWHVGLCCLAVFIVVVALTRYVSLGSVLAAISFPLFILGLDKYINLMEDFSWVIFACILSAMVIWGHRGNLVRLWKNTERKLGEKKEDYETRVNK